MLRQTRVLLVLLCAAAPCRTASALSPDQVIVLANANVEESVALARYYAQARAIPSENILLLKTTDQYMISRQDYDSQIRAPLQEFLASGGLAERARCLCLMWGMPVRVGASEPQGVASQATALYRTYADKALYRLVIDHKLLGTVGRKFPAPRTAALAPLGELFESPIPAPAPPLPSASEVIKDIDSLFQLKRSQVARLPGAGERAIGWRQLMALQADIYGLTGLINFIGEAKPENAPNTSQLIRLRNEANARFEKFQRLPATPENISEQMDAAEIIGGAHKISSHAHEKLKRLSQSDASVDSELSLLWWGGFELVGSQINPLYWGVKFKTGGARIPPTLMTARIDGPTPADARRMIDDSLATEKTGLTGAFYIDAGGKVPTYDAHLLKLRDFLTTRTKMKVVTDTLNTVFAEGTCPDTALYVGWYSLRNYVPAFTWNTGSVGWHIASFEAMNLRDPASNEWCVKMVQNGIAATVGAVDEPYLNAFPLPEEFFPLLLTGEYCLAECFWRTSPGTSWRLTLIGDPLYRPFAANPQVSADSLEPGLAPTTE